MVSSSIDDFLDVGSSKLITRCAGKESKFETFPLVEYGTNG